MKKTFSFGKVDYYKSGKKNCLVTLEVELEYKDCKTPCFSVSGNVWNNLHTDIVMGGQCIDDIYNEFKGQLLNRKLYEKIMDLWQKYHLNDMNAGCKHQRAEKWDEILLDDSKPRTQENMAIWTYPEDNILQSIGRYILDHTHGKIYHFLRKIIKINVWATNRHKKGLLTKKCKVCGYRYGTEWKYEKIDSKDLLYINKRLLN